MKLAKKIVEWREDIEKAVQMMREGNGSWFKFEFVTAKF
jgi:hypothetical protein